MYISDLTHFLDSDGNIPKTMHKDAREMASFLALIVDEATKKYPEKKCNTVIRCIDPACDSEIITEFMDDDQKINWACGDCETSGLISNWQGSRWDNITV